MSLASRPKIHKIDLTGLKVSVDLRVDNLSKERITVKIPSVRLSYKGKLLASTAINDRTYTVEPVSTGKISGIIIEAGYLNLSCTVFDTKERFILASRQNKKPPFMWAAFIFAGGINTPRFAPS